MKKKIIVAIFATCMLATSACGTKAVPTQAEVARTETSQENQTVEIAKSEAEPTKEIETDSTWDTKEVIVAKDITADEFDKANHNMMPSLSVNLPVQCEPITGEYAVPGDYMLEIPLGGSDVAQFKFAARYRLNKETALDYGKENYESTIDEYGRYILTTAGTQYGVNVNIYDKETACALNINMSYTIYGDSPDERDDYLNYVENNISFIKEQVAEWSQDFTASNEPLETANTDNQTSEIDLSKDEWVQNYIDAFYTTYYGECGKLELIYVDGNGNDKVIATDTDNNLTWECQLLPLGDDAWQAVYNGEAIFDFAINTDGTLDVDTPFEEYAAIYGTFTKQ